MTPADHSSPSSSSEDAIHQAAAIWLTRRDGGFDRAEATEFARWRDSDPRHLAALRRAEAAQNLLMRLSETPAAAAMMAEADALCAARTQTIPFSTIWKVAAGLAAAACLAVFFWPAKVAVQSANATYHTDAGQHQSVDLPDGSKLVLNGSTTVAVSYAAAERKLELAAGEAHFYVAKDASRPFVVSVGSVTVRAVGTTFNVRRQAAAVEVLVTEGKVQVSRDQSTQNVPADPIFLTAGERAVIDSVPFNALAAGNSTPKTDEESNSAPRLMFSNTPLSEVIQRFNQYNRVQMEIADPDLAQRSVGGNFNADNVESFISLLQAAGDVRVERVSESRVLLHKGQ
jgi:transmembrane sensor